jgi:hypothetical protein
VVAELAAQGVDFVTGPGEAIWVTYYWDEKKTVSFSSASG